MKEDNINSKSYWNTRFKTDWIEQQGIEQTEFFSNIACSLFPNWLIREIKKDNLTLCDMGCALGDGVNILGKFLDCYIEGVDFSEEAIVKAKNRFPQHNFMVGDILTDEFSKVYDIIFSSNTLEHFINPWEIVNKFSYIAKKYIVLLIPFEEEMVIEEHEYNFQSNKILININDFTLIYANSIDGSLIENTLYSDKQILLLYSKNPLDKKIITLNDYIENVTTKKYDQNLLSEKNNHNESKAYLEEKINNLVKEYESRIEEKNIQIKILNEKYTKDVDSIMKKMEAKVKCLQKKNDYLEDKDKKILELIDINEKLQKDLELKTNDLEFDKTCIHNLQNELQNVYKSFSWRITKMFRLITRITGLSKIHNLIKKKKKENITYTELILFKVKSSRIYPTLKKIMPVKIKSSLSRKYNIPSSLDIMPLEDNLAKDLKEFVIVNKNSKILMIISGVKYVDNEGQRNIRLAYEAIQEEIKIIFVYWRWNVREPIEKSTADIFQIPLDYLHDQKTNLFENTLNELTQKIMLIEFPHSYANDILDYANCFGWISIYDIIDDWEEFQKKDQAIWFDKKVELEIANKVDIRIATAEKLLNKIKNKITNKEPFYLISNGVDPNKMHEVTRQIEYCYSEGNMQIGYFGHLTDAWFDWEMIIKIAEKRNDWTFHIIGYGQPDELNLPSNIKLYGKKEPRELPFYAAFWDVAIIPFINCELTLSVNPIKAYEYLQLKLPVVASNMPEIEKFPYTQIAIGAEMFEKAIENSKEIIIDEKLIKNFISNNTWEIKLKTLLACVEKFNPEDGYKIIYKE